MRTSKVKIIFCAYMIFNARIFAHNEKVIPNLDSNTRIMSRYGQDQLYNQKLVTVLGRMEITKEGNLDVKKLEAIIEEKVEDALLTKLTSLHKKYKWFWMGTGILCGGLIGYFLGR